MKLKKPKPPSTVYIVATDKETKRSKGLTIYNATPEQVLETLSAMINGQQPTRVKAAS